MDDVSLELETDFATHLYYFSLILKKVLPLPIRIGESVTTEPQFFAVAGFVLAVVVSLAQWMEQLLSLFLFLSSFFLNSVLITL
jgi:hypothetical protein